METHSHPHDPTLGELPAEERDEELNTNMKNTIACIDKSDSFESACFSSVPNEVQLMILDSLRDQAEWETFLSLRLVSKHWMYLTESYVAIPVGLDRRQAFRIEDAPLQVSIKACVEVGDVEDADIEADLTDLWDPKVDEDNMESPIPRICYLLSRPNCRPEWIKMLPTFVPINPSWPLVPENTKTSRMKLYEVLSKVDHVVPRDLLESLSKAILDLDYGTENARRSDAQLAAVLATCTNLERIQLPDVLVKCGPRSMAVIKYAAKQVHKPGRAPVLGRLKHLELKSPKGIQVFDVLNMLSLPKLENLQLWNPVDFHTRDYPELGPKPLNVNTMDISLHNCAKLTNQGLLTILQACRTVRSLYISSSTGSTDNPQLCYSGALKEHGKDLEFLWLDDPGRRTTPEDFRNLFRAIRHMPKLRTLVLYRRDIGDAESFRSALPASLEELLVLGCLSEREKSEVHSAIQRSPELPNLRRTWTQRLDVIPWSREWRDFVDYCVKERRLPGPKASADLYWKLYVILTCVLESVSQYLEDTPSEEHLLLM
ncbi:hypothetical protein GGR53DRAFT_531240 [Hypoxylon sp. FL1150]|nr:hypothetical protein GGR53DRAFT_531240 [Hypoxylon sp. FL1150]